MCLRFVCFCFNCGFDFGLAELDEEKERREKAEKKRAKQNPKTKHAH
jgi:hypothetical protein